MAKTKKVISTKAGAVFKCIWLVFATVMYIVGIVIFKNKLSENNDWLAGWLLWGLLCCFPLIGKVFSGVVDSAKRGKRQGANDYTATVTSTHVTVENHPFRGMLMGIAAGIIGGLLIGPVVLPLAFLGAIIELVNYFRSRPKNK